MVFYTFAWGISSAEPARSLIGRHEGRPKTTTASSGQISYMGHVHNRCNLLNHDLQSLAVKQSVGFAAKVSSHSGQDARRHLYRTKRARKSAQYLTRRI